MPKFEQKYSEEDFLKVLEGTPKTIGFITKRVGSARQTTLNYVNSLVEKGAVIKESVDDGALYIYSKNEKFINA